MNSQQTSPVKRRVLSGIQPTSGIHLGNYLGAIQQWVARQHEKDNFFCVVDLHALTVPQDPVSLRRHSKELIALYFACGLNPETCTIFLQSHVRAHTEAAWLLTCETPLGWLNKMTQFKDKSQKQESIGAGLLIYPVLMAADILLYNADDVPVGEDQKQHVELARNIAEKFNRRFGEILRVPTPVIPSVGARIMGLDNPLAKMSKSNVTNPGHAVLLTDSPDTILKTFKRAVTDSGGDIRFSDDPAKAGVNNLLSIYSVVVGKTREQTERDFQGARGYGDLKIGVAEVVIAALNPIRERFNSLMQEQSELDAIILRGAERASAVAEKTLKTMKDAVGLYSVV
ncbi:MAG: tryptophan--tRNA ligase [Pseudomonadota bacterium]